MLSVVDAPVKKRNDQAVKVERRIAAKLRVIVEAANIDKLPGKQTSVAELLSDMIRDRVNREYEKALKTLGQVDATQE